MSWDEERAREIIRLVARHEHGERGWCRPEDCETCCLGVEEILAQARREENEACAKATCEGCAEGWPTEDCDGDLLHILPKDRERPWGHSLGNRTTCEAAAIRADLARLRGENARLEGRLGEMRESLAERLRAEVDFSFVNRAPDEAARVALAYVKERMPTREEIANIILGSATEPVETTCIAPCQACDKGRAQADAILALLAGKVTG